LTPVRVAVNDRSQVSEARRLASTLAREVGLPDAKLAKVALVATEAATNLVKHTPNGGELLVQAFERDNLVGVEIIALDNGPGITNTSNALHDGYSTVGTAGTGLGAIRRQSDFFDIYSQPGRGTALVASLWSGSGPASRSRAPVETGSVRVPRPGERVCGDDWAMTHKDGRSLVLVFDGLGHGIFASEAASEAVSCFRQNSHLSPSELMRALDAALRHTRGGVAAVVEISARRDRLTFVGTGNISGILCLPEGRRSMVSQPGTVGQEIRKVQQFDYPWSRESLLVLYSDGLTSRVDPSRHPGLMARSPSLIAAVLYGEYKRGRDDAVAVVLREAGK
jgi:anti-sigma regulatory factor (Ser/Thr protein kinase)